MLVVHVLRVLLVSLIQKLIYRSGVPQWPVGKNFKGGVGTDLVHYWHLGNQRSKVTEPGKQGAFAESELKSDLNMGRGSHKNMYDFIGT